MRRGDGRRLPGPTCPNRRALAGPVSISAQGGQPCRACGSHASASNSGITRFGRAPMIEYGHFIGGKTAKGSSGRAGEVFQPMTGEVRAKVAFASKAEVAAAVENA